MGVKHMKKEKKYVWWTLFLLIASGIAILLGYYMGMDKGVEVESSVPNEETIGEKMIKDKTIPVTPSEKTISIKKEILNEKGENVPVEKLIIKEIRPSLNGSTPNLTDKCVLLKEQMEDFFHYLDEKEYIKRFGENTDTYAIYKEMLRRMTSKLPVPSGEGLSVTIMIDNIFHLFRIMDTTDIMMIKAVLSNEKQTLEMNLDMFYSWFMAREQCSCCEEIQPSWDLLYHYAGFFLNTIGGRAYLYRRTPILRLLLSYYCVLIIHDADKQGSNSYGIDIVPEVKTLISEINLSPDLMFKSDYLNKLESILDFYNERGRQ